MSDRGGVTTRGGSVVAGGGGVTTGGGDEPGGATVGVIGSDTVDEPSGLGVEGSSTESGTCVSSGRMTFSIASGSVDV